MIDLSLNLAGIFKKYFQGARNVSYIALFDTKINAIEKLLWREQKGIIFRDKSGTAQRGNVGAEIV
jgi:hypothetical protein